MGSIPNTTVLPLSLSLQIDHPLPPPPSENRNQATTIRHPDLAHGGVQQRPHHLHAAAPSPPSLQQPAMAVETTHEPSSLPSSRSRTDLATSRTTAFASRTGPPEKKKKGSQADESTVRSEDVSPKKCSSSSFNPPPSCMERLREELCCAICLEICFEPTTTPCGHSFCKKCLRSAADRCGQRCPKCRQQMSKIRSCTINTVLWNTIQLLFPGEVEARKKAASKSELNQDAENEIHETTRQDGINVRVRRTARRASIATSRGSIRRVAIPSQDDDEDVSLGSISLPSQDEDAALALRLQRREFMGVRRSTERNSSSSVLLARSNLRALASHAISFHTRSRNLQL
ncbi:E3 ubiquitin-protein ligase RNF168-like protein [Drosera capensis]